MERRRWEQLEILFHRAMQMSPTERANFVRTVGADDDLRRELQHLVEAEEHSDRFFENFLRKKPD